MATTVKLILLAFLLATGFTACQKYDVRGFVLSYNSVNDRFAQSMDWNADHPFKTITVSDDSYQVYAMGDSHVGSTDNLDRLISDAENNGAVAVVMNGDLTTGNEKDFYTFQNHLPDPDSLATFQVVGNHDLYFDGWKTYYKLFGSSTYYFTVQTPVANDLYICLDAGSGTLGSNQLDWFKNLLKHERDNYRKCVVFMHVNLFRIRRTLSTNPVEEELQVLTTLCVEHNIDMVVTGHDHKRNVIKLGNTIHITMDALLDGYHSAGYFIMTLKNGALDYDFVNF
jgi:predicted phosphodiesterase